MCGILAFLDHKDDTAAVRDRALRQAALIRHRGPDWTGIYADDRHVLAHERLAIVDPSSGAQPLHSEDGRYVLAVNGEVYNHTELRHSLPWAFRTKSDCEVILPLYASRRPPAEWLERIRGMFAFVIIDRHTGGWLIARDPMGVIPLYIGWTAEGGRVIASEMKALMDVCERVEVFPPGHYWTDRDATPVRWHHRDWEDVDGVADAPAAPGLLRDALADSVKSHLMTDVPYGVLLSGGLDSSVVAALAATFAERRVESGDRQGAWWPRLHTFAIGLEGSPDLAAAQVVADAIGSVHHGFTYTVDEGLDAVRDVIWHTETFDVTTIRASTPMVLMARRIKAMGVKMVLSGEGSDEIFGGYLYFHKAPDPRAFHEETVRKLQSLHLFDCNRANKSMAAFGVEARVPFLDGRFLDHAMRIPARHKMVGPDRPIEKHLLREAFTGWLPDEVLWRQKEQFSDGVGYGWIDGLRDRAESRVSDADLAGASERFAIGTPDTKEAYHYRQIFDELFSLESAAATVPTGKSVACSTPAALAWDASFRDAADPSGRAVAGVHSKAW